MIAAASQPSSATEVSTGRPWLRPGASARDSTGATRRWKGDPDVQLTRLGIAKAARLHGRDLSAQQVYVVGDTPRDVAARRAAAATTVGVASGHYTDDDLHADQAGHVLKSLAEPSPGL